jgi:thymidylate synthase
MNYLNKSGVSSASDAFAETLLKLKEEGLESSPRGQAVRELFMERLEISPLFPIPHFQSRRFNWKYFAGELAWYLDGSRRIDFINNFSNFWKGLTNHDGTINSNYGDLLLHSNQLVWAYEALVKDKDSRQAIAFVSKPDFQYEGNKDFVCTVYLNFWIRNDELNMKVQMRSNDLFYGFSYDVPFFAVVMQNMWHNLRRVYPDLRLGKYYHCADNIHYYERHFETGDAIIQDAENPDPPLFFYTKFPLFTISDGKLNITQEARNFQEEVNKLLESKNLTADSCKEALKQLFVIQ